MRLAGKRLTQRLTNEQRFFDCRSWDSGPSAVSRCHTLIPRHIRENSPLIARVSEQARKSPHAPLLVHASHARVENRQTFTSSRQAISPVCKRASNAVGQQHTAIDRGTSRTSSTVNPQLENYAHNPFNSNNSPLQIF